MNFWIGCWIVIAFVATFLNGQTSSATTAQHIKTGVPDLATEAQVWVNATALSWDKVMVQWGGQDTRAWYLKVYQDSELIFTAMIGRNIHQHLLMGLEPETAYIIILESFTAERRLLSSPPVLVTTLAQPDDPGKDMEGARGITEDSLSENGNHAENTSKPSAVSRMQMIMKHRKTLAPTETPPGKVDESGLIRRLVSIVEDNTSPRTSSTADVFVSSMKTAVVGGSSSSTDVSSIHEKSSREAVTSEPRIDEEKEINSAMPGVVKWALIAGGSGFVVFLFVFVLFFAVFKAQKSSDAFILRRNTRTESLKKGKADQDPEKKPKEEEGTEEKGMNVTSQAKPSQAAGLLAVPSHMVQNRTNSKVYSGVSWGSEFDILEQDDNIYSNTNTTNTMPSSHKPWNMKRISSMFSSLRGPRFSQTENANAIYSNNASIDSSSTPNTTSAANRPRPPVSRQMSLQTSLQTVHQPHQFSPDPRPAQPPSYNTAAAAAQYNPSSPSNPPARHQASWNAANNLLDIVIQPSAAFSPASSSPGQGNYCNTQGEDENNALYVNAGDACGMDALGPPPPIPRR